MKSASRFHRWSARYESFRGQRYLDRLHQAMLDSISDDDPKPTSVLDIGCATGRLLRKARHRWPSADLIGVDPAEGMIEIARGLTPTATFHVAAAESLPLSQASVDLVFSAWSLHHWHDVSLGLREMVRVLRPGGRFCFGDVTMSPWLATLLRSNAKSPAALREYFTHAGLQIQRQQPMLARWLYVTTGVRA